MLHIGLTGGIASGKSTVVTMLRGLGAGIVDCDVIAHDVVEPGSEGLVAVAAAFGPKTLLPDGSMDRAYIGSVVLAIRRRKRSLKPFFSPSSMPVSTKKSKKLKKIKKILSFSLTCPCFMR